MSSSSVNNGSQANSKISVATVATVVPHVHFAEEAVVVASPGPSSNPDSHCACYCRDQWAMRRFQRATSIEVEFLNKFSVSSLLGHHDTCTDIFF